AVVSGLPAPVGPPGVWVVALRTACRVGVTLREGHGGAVRAVWGCAGGGGGGWQMGCGYEQSALGMLSPELQGARARAGMSRESLAGEINYSPSLIGMIESCRRVPGLDFARRCDAALGTTGTFARMQEHLRTAPFPAWFRPFVEYEARAASL